MEGKGKGKGKGKEAAGSEDEGGAGRGALELEVLKAADLFQAEGLLKHCLEGFRGALTVQTVAEHLVWAHTRGPAEARAAATEYFIAHGRAVRVRVVSFWCHAARPMWESALVLARARARLRALYCFSWLPRCVSAPNVVRRCGVGEGTEGGSRFPQAPASAAW